MTHSSFAIGWRGLLMGVVEVLPGISAGTIALLTGIYERLVRELSNLTKLRREENWRKSLSASLIFFVPLALGMFIGFSIALFSVVEFVRWQPQLFWGVISGLLLGTLFVIGREINWRFLAQGVPLGIAMGLLVSFLPLSDGEPPLWLYVVGGLGGFCAWLLPGISGSMVLLLLGLWVPMLEAIRSVELTKIALFFAGLILAFAILPRWITKVLEWHKERVLAFFVGMIGSSMYRAWPWQFEDGSLRLPTLTGGDFQVIGVIFCALLGVCLAFGLSVVSSRNV